jgi:hypothetical protein
MHQAVVPVDLGGVDHPLLERQQAHGIPGPRKGVPETLQLDSVGRVLGLEEERIGREERGAESAGQRQETSA